MDWPTTCGGVKFSELDNFGVCRIFLDGEDWASAEQYYQASKFSDAQYREAIRGVKPRRNMGARMASKFHGQEVQQMGRSKDHDRAEGFRRLEEMYVANRVKFDQNPECRRKLLQTRGPIQASGRTDDWKLWNSRILERIREELKPSDECDETKLELLLRQFSKAEGFDEASARRRIRTARAEFGADQRRVSAVLMDGRDIELFIRPQDSILVLKEHLAFQLGISAPRLKLLLGPRVLGDDASTVEGAGVADSATLSVLISSPVPYDAQVIKHQLHDALREEGLLRPVEG